MPNDRQAYFISTSIPYVNAEPHVGHALEFAQTDAYARFQRTQGKDVFFLTGSDENALKNVQAAEVLGLTTRDLVDQNVVAFQQALDVLDASNDDFIRTSVDERHFAGVDRLWKAVEASGDIYKQHYTGLYCVGCETFYNRDELIDGKCPVHETTPVAVEEENYFFRLSKYGDELHRRISSDELKIVPETRKNEVLRFIEAGLQDISVSRSQERARGWGIEVPGDPDQVIYVWIDALANYITALDYGTDGAKYRRYWQDAPARVHAIGKDILRFHAVYWPGILLSAGVPLPTHVVVHGFLTINGAKMSKTTGNVIDPISVAEEYGADAVRYYLLREISPHGDGDFSVDRIIERYNADLANDLGNLLNRSISMINRYRDGVIPETGANTEIEESLGDTLAEAAARSTRELDAFEPLQALGAIWQAVTATNTYIEQAQPWVLAREARDGEQSADERLDTVLSTLATTIGRLAQLLQPVIPAAVDEIARQLGSSSVNGLPVAGQKVTDPTPIFPRIEVEAEAPAD